MRFFRKTFIRLRRDLRPGVATVRGTKQSTGRRRGGTFAAGAVLPAFAPEIPHRGVHDIGIDRIESDLCATGRKIRSLESLLPRFTAVGRFVQSAIGRIAP